MNLAALTTFVSVVDTGSLVAASERLNVTQSTVTARLKTLESEIGHTLLHRNKSGATLTPAGVKLLHYARVMTGLWQQAKTEAGLPDGTDSLCALGCHPDLWEVLGKPFFDTINGAQVQMAISVHSAADADLHDMLTSGMVDLIITHEPGARGDCISFDLPPQRLVVVSDRKDGPIRFDPGYVFVDHGVDYRRRHGELYHDAGTARVTFDAPGWALAHLLREGGSAYLPASLVAPHVKDGRLHVLSEAEVIERPTFLITRKNAPQAWPWLESAIELLREK